MRRGEARGAEKAEERVELHLLVGKLDDHRTALLDDPALQHGVQNRVQLLLDVLDQQRLALRHALLELVAEVLVGDGRDHQLVARLAILDPRLALALGVDQHRIPRRPRHHDAVLHRQLVRGQAVEVPLADLGVVHQELRGVHVLGHGDVLLEAVLVELALEQQVAELLVEGAQVRHERRRQRAVAGQALDRVVELGALLVPPRLLAGQRPD